MITININIPWSGRKILYTIAKIMTVSSHQLSPYAYIILYCLRGNLKCSCTANRCARACVCVCRKRSMWNTEMWTLVKTEIALNRDKKVRDPKSSAWSDMFSWKRLGQVLPRRLYFVFKLKKIIILSNGYHYQWTSRSHILLYCIIMVI